MSAARYTLDEFVHDMTDLVAAQPDQATLFDRGSSLIARLVRDPAAVPSGTGAPPWAGGAPAAAATCSTAGRASRSPAWCGDRAPTWGRTITTPGE